MSDAQGGKEEFGCSRCWPTSPSAAWRARRRLTREAELIDESHYHVMILGCDRCGQRFVSVFTELIDWIDGEDPQYWTLLPITEGEAGELLQTGDRTTEAQLNALGPDRRCLMHDYPKEGPKRTKWGSGIWVGPHD
ncbi:MAG: hypothetical protein P8Y10_16340 [Gemmatimonadales bacterium]|jgi:hypothetical protein